MNTKLEEYQYLNLLSEILEKGEDKIDRTGVGTKSIFSSTLKFSLQNQFPLLTTKKLHFKSIFYELLWFLKGDTNIKFLKENGVSIWNEWADEKGELGPIYGSQWRNWSGGGDKKIDQLEILIDNLIKNPTSRRHILSAWNVSEIDKMALPPCHILAQFYVNNNNGLSCQMYQRSVDAFLGLPFNIASYALLTYMLSDICNLKPDFLYFVGGDVHLYKNHFEQAKLQLERKPFAFPKLVQKKHYVSINKLTEADLNDFEIIDYICHPSIKADIAI